MTLGRCPVSMFCSRGTPPSAWHKTAGFTIPFFDVRVHNLSKSLTLQKRLILPGYLAHKKQPPPRTHQ